MSSFPLHAKNPPSVKEYLLVATGWHRCPDYTVWNQIIWCLMAVPDRCPGHLDANRWRTEAERSTYSAQPRSRETQYLAYLRDQNLAWWGRWHGRDARRARGPASAGCLPSGTPAPDSGTDSRALSGWWTRNTEHNKPEKNISPTEVKIKENTIKNKRTFCGPNMAER